jgi:hypothetical protein
MTRVGAFAVIAMLALARSSQPIQASYEPLAQAEARFGPLITTGNHPTSDQHGTGDRIGFFRDASGVVWGLPLTVSVTGDLLVCAPPLIQEQETTDTFPAGAAIIGTTSEPTGWRGGTGNLELLLRESNGAIRWQAVHGAPVASGPVCWAQESPGPVQPLNYYRLAPQTAGIQ